MSGEPSGAAPGEPSGAARGESPGESPRAAPGEMHVVGIDHVQLAIPRGAEEAARRFYGGVLGFAEVPKPEPLRARGGLWFQAGPVGIHLGVQDDPHPPEKAHPALVVRGLDAYVARLAAAGCEWRPSAELPGVRRGHTRDPFGNRIELIEAA